MVFYFYILITIVFFNLFLPPKNKIGNLKHYAMCIKKKYLLILLLIACTNFGFAQELHRVTVSFSENPCFDDQTDDDDDDEIDDDQSEIELNEQNPFLVYPNPTRNLLTIQSFYSEAYIILLNPIGRIILEDRLIEGRHVLDLSGLSNGIYYLNIRANNENRIINIMIN